MSRLSPCFRLDGKPKAGLTKGAAEAERLRLIREKGSDPANLHAYRCPVCLKWHVGRGMPTPRNQTKRRSYHGSWS